MRGFRSPLSTDLGRLVEHGYARAEGGGRYVLGPRVLTMAGAMLQQHDSGAWAGPILRELHAEVGHTVHFAMLSDDEAVYLEKLVDPGLPYRFASRVGGRMPLHCTAIGKAILAALPPEEGRVIDRLDCPARTPATLIYVGALREELAAVRERGFAVDDEENEATSVASAPPCATTAARRRTRSACRR